MTAALPGFEPIDLSAREPLTSEITRRLLDYILSGAISAGERMPSERKLAEALGVGRSIVRQALKSLTLLGLLEVRQGDGTYLRRTDAPFLPVAIEWGLLLGAKHATDLVEARHYLEVVLAGLAAERREDAALEEMRQAAAVMTATVDPDEFIAADLAFHKAMAEAAGNQTLLQIMTSIRTLLQVWIGRVVHKSPEPGATASEHNAILRAIEDRDVSSARNAMEGHMAHATTRLQRSLDERHPEDATRS